MAYLLGMSEAVKGQKFELSKARVTIGRNQVNDIVLADEAVSSQHCYIVRQGESFFLHDLNSTNGTMLNFERVTDRVELKPQHVIQIGACEFVFNDEAAAKPDAKATSKLATSAMTKVVVDVERPVINPTFFESVSPFGPRRKSHRKIWGTIYFILGLGGIILLVLLLKNLLG